MSMDRFLAGTRAAGAGAASQAAPALARGSDPDGLAELLVEGAAFESGAANPSTWEVLARDGLRGRRRRAGTACCASRMGKMTAAGKARRTCFFT